MVRVREEGGNEKEEKEKKKRTRRKRRRERKRRRKSLRGVTVNQGCGGEGREMHFRMEERHKYRSYVA